MTGREPLHLLNEGLEKRARGLFACGFLTATDLLVVDAVAGRFGEKEPDVLLGLAFAVDGFAWETGEEDLFHEVWQGQAEAGGVTHDLLLNVHFVLVPEQFDVETLIDEEHFAEPGSHAHRVTWDDGQITLTCKDLRTRNFGGRFGTLEVTFDRQGTVLAKEFHV